MYSFSTLRIINTRDLYMALHRRHLSKWSLCTETECFYSCWAQHSIITNKHTAKVVKSVQIQSFTELFYQKLGEFVVKSFILTVLTMIISFLGFTGFGFVNPEGLEAYKWLLCFLDTLTLLQLRNVFLVGQDLRMKLKISKTSTLIPDEMPFPKIYWTDSHVVILVLIHCVVCAHLTRDNVGG